MQRIHVFTAMISILCILQVGCYNTYTVSLDELRNIQESDGESFKSINTTEGGQLTVTENSRVGIVDNTGSYRPISPFNFTIGNTQLVAPDDDLLIATAQIQEANIKIIDPTNTLLVVGGSLLAVVGAAAAMILLAPDCEGKFCNTNQ